MRDALEKLKEATHVIKPLSYTSFSLSSKRGNFVLREHFLEAWKPSLCAILNGGPDFHAKNKCEGLLGVFI